MPKIEITKVKYELDNKFRINIKMNIEISITNIFNDAMNNDLE